MQTKYSLTPEARQILDSLSQWLAANPTEKVLLTGHTDNVGDPKLNFSLSENRVRVTASYLVHHGVRGTQVTFRAMGGEQPTHSNDSEDTMRFNRRVEITRNGIGQ